MAPSESGAPVSQLIGGPKILRQVMGGAGGGVPKAQAEDCEITYIELATRLKKHGFKGETEASITNKLARGIFSATFFLACIAALELDGVAPEEI